MRCMSCGISAGWDQYDRTTLYDPAVQHELGSSVFSHSSPRFGLRLCRGKILHKTCDDPLDHGSRCYSGSL